MLLLLLLLLHDWSFGKRIREKWIPHIAVFGRNIIHDLLMPYLGCFRLQHRRDEGLFISHVIRVALCLSDWPRVQVSVRSSHPHR
jgi:hypothetical protein